MPDEWQFLIDECHEPELTSRLENDGLSAEHVIDVLWQGADDFEHILPYCRREDRILVTNNVTDFGNLPDRDHEGIVLVFDNKLRPHEIEEGVLDIVEAYPNRNELRGYEKLDEWL